VAQMIESYTINGAYANFLEDETGSIEAGKAADLVVLSRDITSCPPQEIAAAEVELTLFRGRPVYAGGAFAGLTD
ncbi:MAG TPA: amidohydrolase family protein, partial [Thermoleophilia bacterium]|nr:amidohydrolase family protein [Thermoleophilia bacterium]